MQSQRREDQDRVTRPCAPRATPWPFIGYGVGLRPKHYPEIFGAWPRIDWFEAITENFLVPGGRPRRVLRDIRARYPVVLHGVSLSIGSTDPLDRDYLRQVRDLIADIQPAWVSDHLCWSHVSGVYLHDLLPLAFTEEVLRHVVERVRKVQDFLGQRILLENVSSYFTFAQSHLSEAEFLAAVADEADCGILLDVNNLYVNAYNHGFDARRSLERLPPQRIGQMHLAGYSDRGTFLHDTHDHPVWPGVWELFHAAVDCCGPVSVSIEWDANLPPFVRVLEEAERARGIATEVLRGHHSLARTATASQ